MRENVSKIPPFFGWEGSKVFVGFWLARCRRKGLFFFLPSLLLSSPLFLHSLLFSSLLFSLSLSSTSSHQLFLPLQKKNCAAGLPCPSPPNPHQIFPRLFFSCWKCWASPFISLFLLPCCHHSIVCSGKLW